MKPLTETPDQLFILNDEVEVRARLVELNLYDTCKLAEARVPVGVPKQGFRIYQKTHPTHWISVEFFTGFDNPADNGYMLTAAPKNKHSKEDFMQRIPPYLNFNKIHFMEHWPEKVPQN